MALPNHRPPSSNTPPQLNFTGKSPVRFLMKSDGCVWEELKMPANIDADPTDRRFKCVYSPRHTKERPSTILGKEANWTKEQIVGYHAFSSIELIDEAQFKLIIGAIK